MQALHEQQPPTPRRTTALPTFYDSCSLSVGEAAASGLPVVTTRHNGACEMLTHGRDGFVLDHPADNEQLADYLGQLLCAATHIRMGLAARRMALRYPLDRNTDEILAVYEEILQRRGQHSRRRAA